jgi:hypothetical protein
MTTVESDDRESGYADDDPGRLVAVCPATPGWWAVYGPPEDFRAPVAVWLVTESVIRLDREVPGNGGRLKRFHTVYGVDPTGGGWDGTPIEQEVEYVYEPSWVPPENRP